MQRALFFIDGLSTAVGKVAGWAIVGLTLLISYEVFARYVFARPNAWAFDAQVMLFGALFMLSGACTLAKNNHVRGDVIYTFLSPRGQAAIDLVLYLVFFFPGVIALVVAGYTFAGEAWAIGERSPVTVDGPPLFPFKAVIPISGALLLLQGAAEFARCIACARTGTWPRRAGDVEEVDVEKLKQMIRSGG